MNWENSGIYEGRIVSRRQREHVSDKGRKSTFRSITVAGIGGRVDFDLTENDFSQANEGDVVTIRYWADSANFRAKLHVSSITPLAGGE